MFQARQKASTYLVARQSSGYGNGLATIKSRVRFPAAGANTRLGWVTVFGQANHLSISLSHSSQLSLLPSVKRKLSTSQDAGMICSWGVDRYGAFHLWINMWVAGKAV